MKTARFLSLLFFFVIVWSGCGSDDDNGAQPMPTNTEVSGSISKSATWSGTVKLTDDADIGAGIHITVAKGTVFRAADGAVLRVHGNLTVNGTAGAPVSMEPAVDTLSWAGIVVESGGAAQLHHITGSKVATLLDCKTGALACLIDGALFNGLGQAVAAASTVTIEKSILEDMSTNAMQISVGGNVTVTDSEFRGAPGDLIILNGGALTMSYCDIGANPTTEHDAFHISSSSGLNISYTNIIGAAYAISIANTSNASVTYNNFLNNGIDVSNLGSNVAIDMSANYWDNGQPSGLGSEFIFNNTSASPILAAGPRTP
jgi:hypothetical protein